VSGLKKIKRGVLKGISNKIIGYFAVRRGTPSVLCDEDACVIGSSKANIGKYITTLASQNIDEYIIKKTTFGEIFKGMMMGGVYALDEEAYKVYFPLAKAKGMNLAEFKIDGDDQPPHPDAIRLMKIAWLPAK
jgi:hypothetical protein